MAYTTWTIERDRLYEEFAKDGYEPVTPSREGVTYSTDPEWGWLDKVPVTKDTPGARKFYLYDDDRILYYEGWFVTVGDTDGWEDLFGWGAADAGCTYVQDGRHRTVIG